MGVSLEAYRARIGLYGPGPCRKPRWRVPVLLLLNYGTKVRGCVKLAFIIALLLVCCGDVEVNPGPPPTGPKAKQTDVTTPAQQRTLRPTQARLNRSESGDLSLVMNKGEGQQGATAKPVPDEAGRPTPSSRDTTSPQARPMEQHDLDTPEGLKRQVMYLTSHLSTLEQELNNVNDRLSKAEAENTELRNKCDKLENQSRRNNLLFHGIPESNGRESWEECEQKVKSVMKDKMGMNSETVDNEISIERAHRLPVKSRDGKPRPVIVKFVYYKQKESVMKQARQTLKDSDFRVSHDFSEHVRLARRNLIPFMVKAREDNKEAFLSFDKLSIEGQMFKWDFDSNSKVMVGKTKNDK